MQHLVEKLFAPAVFLVSRLRYWQKFTLFGIGIALPVCLGIFLWIQDAYAKSSLTQQGMAGLRYNQSLRIVVEQLQRHRGKTRAFLSGEAVFRKDLVEEQNKIDAAMSYLTTINLKIGKQLGVAASGCQIPEKWLALKTRVYTLDAATSFGEHTKLILEILDLMKEVRNRSHQFLEPYPVSYVLDMVSCHIPAMTEQLCEIRALGASLIGQKNIQEKDKIHLFYLFGLVQSSGSSLAQHMKYMATRDALVFSPMDKRCGEVVTDISQFLEVFRAQLQQPPDSRMPVETYFHEATQRMQCLFRLYDELHQILLNILDDRAQLLTWRTTTSWVIMILGILLVVYLGIGLYFSLKAAVARLEYAAKKMEAGQSVATIHLDNKDELSDIAVSFNKLIRSLEEKSRAAQAANVAKGLFLANMSHEIRTPLNGILGFLHLLATTTLSIEQTDYVQEMKSSAEVLLYLVNDILDFSKIEAGKLEMEQEDFPLRKVLEDTVFSLACKAYEKNLGIYSSIQFNVPEIVRGDAARLKQILYNLLNNAIKFTQQGKIILTAQCTAEDYQEVAINCEVQDTGIGMAEATRKKLFAPCAQPDHAMTKKYGGTGLGLAITKKLVELMRGEIDVESELGVGSRFSFTAKFDKAAMYPDRIPLDERLRGVPVLVISDDQDEQRIIVSYLQEAGCKVSQSNAGEEAMAFVRETLSPSLVVVMNHKFWPVWKEMAVPNARWPVLLVPLNQQEDFVQLKQEAVCLVWTPVKRDDLLYCVLQSTLHLPGDATRPGKLQTRKTDTIPMPLSGKILLVEDNVVNRKIFVKALEKKGWSCDTSENGEEAVAACQRNDYTLVFMDCHLPDMDGYDVTRKIRGYEGSHKHTVIVATTAAAMQGDREKCLEAGMDHYIAKPIDFQQVFKMIQKYCQRGKSETK